MPEDLDEFELERTKLRLDEETVASPLTPEPRGGRFFPLILATLALLACGILAVVYVVFRPAAPKAGQASPAPTTPAQATAAPSLAALALPALDESDDHVRRLAAHLSAHPELARWLARAGLVRTLTAVVTNVADGETPRPHLGFLAPAQRFRASGARGRRVVADPAGYAGYDRFADAVASVDAAGAAGAYRAIEPLFDAAYRDLGHPEGRFRAGLDRALQTLVDTPVPPPDAALVPHAIGFRYLDPRFEGLTAAQKQFLRLGPRNVRLIQAKLRELQAALASAPALPIAQTH